MMLEFRKSSYPSSGDNCVEVAPILTFRKSSYSTGGENCVEVADLPTTARPEPLSLTRERKPRDAGARPGQVVPR